MRAANWRLSIAGLFKPWQDIGEIDENDDSTRSGPNGTAGQATGPGFSRLTPAQRRVYDLMLEGFIEKEVARD